MVKYILLFFFSKAQNHPRSASVIPNLLTLQLTSPTRSHPPQRPESRSQCRVRHSRSWQLYCQIGWLHFQVVLHPSLSSRSRSRLIRHISSKPVGFSFIWISVVGEKSPGDGLHQLGSKQQSKLNLVFLLLSLFLFSFNGVLFLFSPTNLLLFFPPPLSLFHLIISFFFFSLQIVYLIFNTSICSH